MGIEVFHGPDQVNFDAWIKTAGPELDAVLLSRPDVAEDVLDSIRRCSRARVVYYGHDLHFQRMRQQAAVTGDAGLLRRAEPMRERESAIWRRADLSLYPSEEEVGVASALAPGAAVGAIVPYCFDVFGEARGAPAGQEIVFVAGFGHPPNEDAAVWFVREIFPLVRDAVPGASLRIIGSNPSAGVRGLGGDGVEVFADVSDAELAAAYERARVAVVPLRCGAGVKLKVVEALRAGVPLVTTSVGAQGLAGLASEVAVEDDAALFAGAVVALLRDDLLWAARCVGQVAYARAHFSRQALADSLLRALAIAS
jgi:glycosyltransferase involved in cell wall biosynthesis